MALKRKTNKENVPPDGRFNFLDEDKFAQLAIVDSHRRSAASKIRPESPNRLIVLFGPIWY